MSALAQPQARAANSGVRALFRGNVAASRQLLTAAHQRATEEAGGDPVIPALGLALGPVIESLISGSTASVNHAIAACESCISGDVANQRSKYQSVVDNALDSIPVAGSIVSLLWSPLQAATEVVTDLANITDSATRESHLHCASGVEGLLKSIKSIFLFMMGSTASAIFELRSAYRAFLAIPESTASEWAKNCRCLGLGNFAVMLSYVEPAFAATFNAVSMSFGMSREDGMSLLKAASDRCPITYNVPTVFAAVSLSVLELIKHARLVGSSNLQAQAHALDSAKASIQNILRVDPANMLGNWVMSHVLRRMSDFEGSTRIMQAIFDKIAPRYENTDEVEIGARAAASSGVSPNRVASRLRFELAQCQIIRLKYDEAVDSLSPLVADASSYIAKGMALMLCGGALACLGRHSESISMFKKVLNLRGGNEDTPVGPMDLVLIRKARVNVLRSKIASMLSMHEMNYFLGYTAISGSVTLQTVFEDLCETLAKIQGRFESMRNVEGADGGGGLVEELMAALFLTGSVGSGLRHDDIAVQHLTRVIELADAFAGDAALSTDPYHVPFAMFELGLLHLRAGRPREAVGLFEQARKATDYTFDQALWYRSQGPLARARKQAE